MPQDYRARLCISCDSGDGSTQFLTKSGQLVAVGYDRIVIGQRGPYVEYSPEHVWALGMEFADEPHYYYRELRTKQDFVKVYHQIHRVDYADYLPGKYYVSPFELYVDGKVLIEKLKRGKS